MKIFRCSPQIREKPGFWESDEGRETGFFTKYLVAAHRLGKNPVSAIAARQPDRKF